MAECALENECVQRGSKRSSFLVLLVLVVVLVLVLMVVVLMMLLLLVQLKDLGSRVVLVVLLMLRRLMRLIWLLRSRLQDHRPLCLLLPLRVRSLLRCLRGLLCRPLLLAALDGGCID